MSRFQERVAAGQARIKSHAAERVALRRAEYTTEDVPAIVGSTRIEEAAVEGLQVRIRIRDYLIDVADYQINEVQVLPQSGDEIVETIGEVDCVFEVFSPGGSEPPWRFSDPGRTRYRIHTREVAADD